jgi:signal transduction histidine kinase
MLIDEMLTIADLDRGTLALKLTEVDLAPILAHVADEIGRQYPRVEIVREVADRLNGPADPVRFAEVVRQLLDNACRYSPEDRPVLLKGRAMVEGVLVSVTDHGEGVRRDVVAKAFNEPFSAGEEILRKERAGAGVGLHMARQIVLQHGGIMWADPVPAGGTRVSFVIPAHEGQTVTRPPSMADPDAEPRRPEPATDPTDDEPTGTVVPFHQRTSSASSS